MASRSSRPRDVEEGMEADAADADADVDDEALVIVVLFLR